MNRLAIVNEQFIFLASLNMILFTDWVGEAETQFFYGYFMIGTVLACIVYNLCFVLYYGFRSIGLLYKKYYNLLKYKWKKWQISLKEAREKQLKENEMKITVDLKAKKRKKRRSKAKKEPLNTEEPKPEKDPF